MSQDSITIRLVEIGDHSALARYFNDNQRFFQPWQPIRDEHYHTEVAWQRRIVDYTQQHQSGHAAHFVGVENNEVVAHCSLTQIVYGPFCACYMGYGVAEAFEGQGLMTAVCRHSIVYAFEQLQLNRIMANYMPSNVRSGRLLNKLGFVEEGLAKRYLKINGKWEDHVLTALINPNTCSSNE